MTSVELVRELFAHEAWADTELLRAVGTHSAAASDERLLRTMHHIVVVQRLFTAMLTSAPFDMDKERRPVKSVAELQDLSAAAQAGLASLVGGLTSEALDAAVENPRMPDLKSTVAETLMHVVLHSQNHRGQCLTWLRELTGQAPTLDFIWWVKLGRPRPALAAGAGE